MSLWLGLSSQVQRWYGHTSTFVTFSGARFFYDLELDLSYALISRILIGDVKQHRDTEWLKIIPFRNIKDG